MYEGMLAETVRIDGHGGDSIDAYLARPLGAGPCPGVVVIHHMPGWDAGSKEITRTFAANGYVAICPNLHHREGPGAVAVMVARVRESGGVPDERFVGDTEAAIRFLRSLPYSSGKVGAIGYCSGGRQAYIAACKMPSLDAVVDCYGGRVVMEPDQLTDRTPVSPFDMTKDMAVPLLGLFGFEDANPSSAEVAKIEAELKRLGKTYEFHSYENAGHAFFAVNRPNYRQEAAADGWEKVFAWFGKYLGG